MPRGLLTHRGTTAGDLSVHPWQFAGSALNSQHTHNPKFWPACCTWQGHTLLQQHCSLVCPAAVEGALNSVLARSTATWCRPCTALGNLEPVLRCKCSFLVSQGRHSTHVGCQAKSYSLRPPTRPTAWRLKSEGCALQLHGLQTPMTCVLADVLCLTLACAAQDSALRPVPTTSFPVVCCSIL